MRNTTKRRPPKRPKTPHNKGLADGARFDLVFRRDALQNLRARARYETVHYRLEHNGKGHVTTPGDIIRRLVDEYFEKVSPMPDDEIAVAMRAFPTT
jgi:hypothetical protein